MIHVSGCCNPSQYTTSSYYINGDTTAFVQLIISDLFTNFPTLKFDHPARRRRDPLPLGTLPRDRAS